MLSSMERFDREVATVHARLDTSPKMESPLTRVEEPLVQAQLQSRVYEHPPAWMELEGLPQGCTFPNLFRQLKPEALGASLHPMAHGGILADLQPGLPPHETMLEPFRKVVSYASY